MERPLLLFQCKYWNEFLFDVCLPCLMAAKGQPGVHYGARRAIMPMIDAVLIITDLLRMLLAHVFDFQQFWDIVIVCKHSPQNSIEAFQIQKQHECELNSKAYSKSKTSSDSWITS